MANHVTGYMKFHSISEDGKKVLNGVYEKLLAHKDEHGECHLAYAFFDSLDDLTITDVAEKVGAKWAYAYDMEEDGMFFRSAWTPTTEFCEWLVGEIGQVDENVIASLQYEDEMPNFIGVQVFDASGIDDAVEDDWEEIRECLCDVNSDLAEQWDAENEEWKDDGDLVCDYLWEYVDTWQNRYVTDMVQFILDNRS